MGNHEGRGKMKWAVEMIYNNFGGHTVAQVTAETPGQALDTAIKRMPVGHNWYRFGSDSAPQYPQWTVRPQEHVEVQLRAERDGRDAKEMTIQRWLATKGCE